MRTEATTAAETVTAIWHEILGNVPQDQPGITFFEAGGESISATRLVVRVEEELGVEIEVGDIFEEDPSLPALIRIVTDRSDARTTS
ncbi:acyl carrier protein [Streptomyces sp. NPDC015139]|uniref:acyl carrier protein n=1 Tax=Streptomyces sp. NPDC015139 TaxID=3364942 RepID=UPI0036FF99F8